MQLLDKHEILRSSTSWRTFPTMHIMSLKMPFHSLCTISPHLHKVFIICHWCFGILVIQTLNCRCCSANPCDPDPCGEPDQCYALPATCAIGVLHGEAVCTWVLTPGAPCDDHNAWTVNDTCDAQGQCHGSESSLSSPQCFISFLFLIFGFAAVHFPVVFALPPFLSCWILFGCMPYVAASLFLTIVSWLCVQSFSMLLLVFFFALQWMFLLLQEFLNLSLPEHSLLVIATSLSLSRHLSALITMRCWLILSTREFISPWEHSLISITLSLSLSAAEIGIMHLVISFFLCRAPHILHERATPLAVLPRFPPIPCLSEVCSSRHR